MKTRFVSLYHPSYVPDTDWLKLQLLFWDSISRIVPDSMTSIYGDEYISHNFGIDPKLCPSISPGYEDLGYFNKHNNAIQKAFEKIHHSVGTRYETVDRFGVHATKAPEWVFESLVKLGLAEMPTKKEQRHSDEHYLVHPEAGKLILSCLGSNIANRRGLQPITDQESSFYISAANEINGTLADNPDSSVESALGMLILRSQVPSNLEKLSFVDIILLREHYEDLRIAFHNTVSAISQHRNLKSIIEKRVYEQELAACLQSYQSEIAKFNSIKQKVKRLVTDWKTEAFTISIGGLCRYVAGGPKLVLNICIGSAGALRLANALFSEKQVSDEVKSFHYLQALNKYLDAKISFLGIRPFLMGVRYE